MQLQKLKDKKIAIVGFAREGRDTFLALQKLLAKKEIGKNKIGLTLQGPGLGNLAVFDEKEIKEKDLLFKGKKIKVYSGKNYLNRLKDYQVVFKTPGIPQNKIKLFLAKGAIITSQTEVFFDNFRGLIVGITGTKGKGTTATLIYEILKQAGKKVHLVGNIGKPVFQLLLKAKPSDVFVYELSSHQLQDLKKSPQIAVFLNLFCDHLDYYPNLQAYKKAKQPISQFQGKDDFFIYNSQDKTAREFAKRSKATKIAFDKMPLLVKTKLKGEFNLLNIKAAFAVGRLLGIGEGQMKKTIADFKGLEHRLEYVGKFRGINFYNDSMSTLPEVAVKAIEAVKPETLIAGGSDKGSDYKEMAKAILKYKIKNLILLERQANKGRDSSALPQNDGCGVETGEKILIALKGKNILKFKDLKILKFKDLKTLKFKDLKIFKTSRMREAVAIAFKETKRGQVCLLSPGSASFNLFKSYTDRGEQFKKAARQDL